jgi:hypothetical protein
VTCCYVVVELRGFEPLTPCMPCHPHYFTKPSAASLPIASVLRSEVVGQGAVVRREVECGVAADNMLTDQDVSESDPGVGEKYRRVRLEVRSGSCPVSHLTLQHLGARRRPADARVRRSSSSHTPAYTVGRTATETAHPRATPAAQGTHRRAGHQTALLLGQVVSDQLIQPSQHRNQRTN